MKRNANTATKPVTVAAVDTAWKFTPASIALNGHVFTADKYAVAEKGDVYVLAKVEGVAVRIHVGKASPVYHEALEAAIAATKPAKQAEPKPAAEPAKPVEAKADEPAKQAKPATKRKAPAKAAKQPEAAAEPAKPVETKPAPAAKQPKAKAAKPATQPKAEMPADNAWIGTAIEGKGWRIVFDDAAQRTRVIAAAPSAKQKAAIDAAGFYWSNTTKSWNKKLTRKAYRAAQALAETLNALK